MTKSVYKELRQVVFNNLTVGIAAGVMIGLLLAMLLGVMNGPDQDPWPENEASSWIQNATAWMQASAAIASALIAAVTVIVISLTLRATQQMVKSANETNFQTSIMVAEQANAYSAEFRPWVFIEKIEVSHPSYAPSTGKQYTSAKITFRNMGKTPAMYLRVSCKHIAQKKKFALLRNTTLHENTEYNTLGPGLTHEETLKGIEVAKDGYYNTIIMKWSYHHIKNFKNEVAPLDVSELPTTHSELRYIAFSEGSYIAVPSKINDFDRS